MSEPTGCETGGRVPRGWRSAAAVLLAIGLYCSALALWCDQIPQGVHNDTVEEAQRGMYLVEGRHLEVITFAVGNSAETLYLYLVGAAIALLGPTTLAIQIVSWTFAAACIVLGAALVRRLQPALPVWVPVLLFTSSLWLFHYARAGLRAIAAPVVLLALCLLLDRAERTPAARTAALGAGAILGLGVYAYTSCRVLPLVWIVYAATRLLRARAQPESPPTPLPPPGSPLPRLSLAHCYAYILLGTFILSIPNLLFFLAAPGKFLFRGSYVIRGGPTDWAGHVFWTFLLPFHYPDIYRLAVGPAHFTDGVSTSLKLAGLNPIHPIVAVAFVIGLSRAWRRRAEAVPFFLLCTWALGSLLLGFSGPSLTRLLILLPVYLVFAALGLAAVLERFPRLRPVCAALLVVVLAWTAYRYFVTFARSAEAQYVYSQAATPIGVRAAELAAQGARVLCVVAKDFNTVRYLTHDHTDSVRVVEFYRKPLDPRRLPLEELQPHVLLLERNARFATFTNVFPADRHVGTHPAYEEIRLDRKS